MAMADQKKSKTKPAVSDPTPFKGPKGKSAGQVRKERIRLEQEAAARRNAELKSLGQETPYQQRERERKEARALNPDVIFRRKALAQERARIIAKAEATQRASRARVQVASASEGMAQVHGS